MAPTSVPVLDSGMPETRPSVVEGLDLLPWSFRVSGMKLSELSLKGGEMDGDRIFLIWWTFFMIKYVARQAWRIGDHIENKTVCWTKILCCWILGRIPYEWEC